MPNCKYCKKTTHTIDNCPDIMCKICKQSGHPHWRCRKEKENIVRENHISNKKEESLEDYLKYLDKEWITLL